MIGFNPLRIPVLATTDEVLFHAPIAADVDVRILLNSIIPAERRFIKPLLGDVYDTLVGIKNKEVTTANKVSLQTALTAGRPNREVYTLQLGDYVNSDTYLTGDALKLWKEHLHKIVAECVYLVAMPPARSKMTAQGVIQNNPPNALNTASTATVDLKDLKHLMDATMQSRILPLIEDMRNWLCKVKYDGYYNEKNCPSCFETKNEQGCRIGGISFSMYDEEQRRRWPND